jgi:hypothetical protein
MTFAIFTRPDIVVNPGWPQLAATALVLISTCGITFAMFGRFFEHPGTDIVSRLMLAALAFVNMFHPDDRVATAAAALVLSATAYGVWRHRRIAPPKGVQAPPASEASESAPAQADDLARVAAEARREIG